LTPAILALLGLGYLGLVFAIAWYGDREAAHGRHPVARPVVYSLSLAVYCTSWAFYGTGGQSAQTGWWLPPTYVGTIVLFLLGWRFLDKIVAISRRQRITSIADFVGARYGRDPAIARFVTIIATLGLIPYVALQLKAVDISFAAVASPAGTAGEPYADTGLIVTVVLALFTILFGTRHADATEHHPGMMLALAFESVVKLAAFLAVGAFVTFGLYDGFGDLAARAAVDEGIRAIRAAHALEPAGHYLALCVLGFFAIFCLPRQFHVAVVENSGPADLRLARWLFPAYLVAISIFILPLANAGLLTFGSLAGADLYVLRLPQSADQSALTLFVFLGGLSAATGMVIVASIALATMISNELVMPGLMRFVPAVRRRRDLTGVLLTVRRLTIVLLLAAAYVYYRLIAINGALAEIGEISMAAVAVFGPLVLAAAYWRDATRTGALVGMTLGCAAWVWTLLVPTLADAGLVSRAVVAYGPGGVEWLRPTALFGLDGLNTLAHGLAWLLSLTTLGLVAGSRLSRRSLLERIQAAGFVDAADESPLQPAARDGERTLRLRELRALAEQFVGPARAASHFDELAGRTARGKAPAPDNQRATDEQLESVQRLLGSVIGAASARRVLEAAISGRELVLEDVVQIVGGASQALEFSRELLQATLQNVDQGISVIDADLRLVAWNRRYVELLRLPADEIRIGRPVEEILRLNALRGELGPGDPEEQIQKRLAHLRRATPYVFQRVRRDGTVLEIRGQPMPGPSGGFVTSYTDVTEYVRAQRALEEANESLERRVQQRTRALQQLNEELLVAKAGAERANQGKTRFLAAASHDLLQPLHAAGLFAGALAPKLPDGEPRALLADLEQCLRSAEGVLTDLLDISKLDAGAVQPEAAEFALDEMLASLDAEFRLQAQARGLGLAVRRTRLVVRSDARLLRRILQNFLSNALRYTERGRVVVGARRRGERVRIEVWDTGPGIEDSQRTRIFEEFYRVRQGDAAAGGGAAAGRGFGLGLAIVDRISGVLGTPVTLRSVPGRGSVFAVDVPRATVTAVAAPESRPADSLAGLHVLVVDDDAAALRGTVALLESWGCVVQSARGAAELPPPAMLARLDLLVVDYHLDQGATGMQLAATLRERLGRALPTVVVTADGGESVRVEAEGQGATCLRKPVKPLALRTVLRRLVPAAPARRRRAAR
jgi:PAS domain S-box-containing protein